MKDVLPIYLPSVTIAGDVVSLIVQRPEQWVAWQTGLPGKVSRDGSDNPDILPNAVLDFGKGSEIRFINDDGKLTGIESLIYKTQELDDRFVNAGGDNMTGDLTINDKKVLTTGDYGHRDDDSGINADMLDGEHGSYYQDASNINKGKLDPARLSGTYNISILGNAATATNANYASRAGDADTLDKKPLSYFAPAGHTHAYVSKTGDTMTGPLVADVGVSNVRIYKNLASYSYSGQFATGTLKITLPKSWTGTMMRIVIKGYDYSYETGAWEVIVGAYSYLGRNGWGGYSAEIRGNAPFSRVRLGHDGSKCVILLGDTSTKWRNLKAAVEEMLAGSSNVDGWETGWEISIITDESGITDIHTPALHDARNYVKKSGDTMTGNLTAPVLTAPEFRLDVSTKLVKGADGSVLVRTGSRYVEIGMMSSSQARFSTDTASFYFNKPVEAAGRLQVYNKETYLAGTEGKIAGNTVWHAGNDGSGSGLDADKVDGKDKVVGYEVRIPAGANLNNYTEPGMYYCPSNADAKTIANRPTDNAFSLLVEQHAGVKQTLTEYLPTDTARVWFRNYYNGTWGPWIKAANVVEKTKTVTGSWYIGPHDKLDDGRRGGSLCRGNHRQRYYFAPNYNASGAKQWYTFDELMTWGGIKSQTNAVGIENVLSAMVNISANGCWETSASVQILERDPNTGAVTTLASGSVHSGSIVQSCTIRKGYQYNIKATLGVPTECYDDGYGAHLWATSYTYKYYVVQ